MARLSLVAQQADMDAMPPMADPAVAVEWVGEARCPQPGGTPAALITVWAVERHVVLTCSQPAPRIAPQEARLIADFLVAAATSVKA